MDPSRAGGRPATESGAPALGTRRLVNFEATVMDRLNAAVVVTDLEGRLLYANPQTVPR
jgi:hypothetical protein